MGLKRRDFGISEEHAIRGNAITEAEFRGYVMAKLEETNAQHGLLRDDLKEQNEDIRRDLKEEITSVRNHIEKLVIDANKTHESHNSRITALESFKNTAMGVILVASAFMSVGMSLLTDFLRGLIK